MMHRNNRRNEEIAVQQDVGQYYLQDLPYSENLLLYQPKHGAEGWGQSDLLKQNILDVVSKGDCLNYKPSIQGMEQRCNDVV